MTNTSVIPWFGFIAHELGIPHMWFIREDLTGEIGIDYAPDVGTTLELIHRWGDVVFVPSEHLRRRLSGPLGRDDLRVAYPPVDPAIVEHSRVRRGAARRVLVSGSIAPHKNQLEAVRAFEILHRSRHDIVLTLMGGVGDTAYNDDVHRYVSGAGLDEAIQFVPHTDDPWPVMADHDVCVIPSRSEASSRAMVEAMLLGLAVVASDVDGNPEKAGGAFRAAVLYEPGRPDDLAAKLAALMGDDQEFHAQAQRGRDYANAEYIERDQLGGLASALREMARTPKAPARSWISDSLLDLAGRHLTDLTILERTVAERDRLASEQGLMRAEREALIAERDILARERRDLQGELADASRLAATYEGSRSWRVTRPVRTLGRALRRVAFRA